MAVTVSLINMKGGVGKSTLAVNLAWYFAWRHQHQLRVLVVDLDPQFNASQYLLGKVGYEQLLRQNVPTVWDIFEQRTRTPQSQGQALNLGSAIHNRARTDDGGRLDLIPSRLELAFTLKTPYQQKEKELADALSAVKAEYDLVIIDCAPTESMLTTAAYLSSDYLLVPVRPEFLSSIGLPLLVQSMGDFHAVYPAHPLRLAGVVFNATTAYAPEEVIAKQEVRGEAQQHQWYVFENEVPYSRSYPRSARKGLSIYSTPHARRAVCNRFTQFALEFTRRTGL